MSSEEYITDAYKGYQYDDNDRMIDAALALIINEEDTRSATVILLASIADSLHTIANALKAKE